MDFEEIINCDNSSPDSINKAERKKAKLENAGYILVEERSGIFYGRFVYRMLKQQTTKEE